MDALIAKDDPAPKRTYRGITHAERKADRRRKLLESALELYGTQGFTSVPIQAVCKHSGVTARHFYEAFEGRDQLLQAVHTEIVESVVTVVLDAVAHVPSDDAMAMTSAGLG